MIAVWQISSVILILSLHYSASVPTASSSRNIVLTDIVDKSKENVPTSLTIDDFLAAKTVKEVDLVAMGLAEKDMTMSAGLFEGDIKAHTAEKIHDYVETSNMAHLARNAILSSWRIWPSNDVPFTISSQYGSYSRAVIASAIAEFHKQTCIRFRAATTRDVDYIQIFPDTGCYSLVGRTGGRQPLSLDAGCIAKGTIMHELMHAVGFFHEQSRTDRDKYVEIVFDEVEVGAEDQFEKYGLNTITDLNEAYDYGSIMHYGPYAFSRFGWQTIVPLRDVAWANKVMGQRGDLSATDVRKLNKLYDCPVDVFRPLDRPSAATTSTTTTTTTTTEAPARRGDCVDGENCWLRKWIVSCDDDAFKVECPVTCNACDTTATVDSSTTTTTTARPITTTTTRTTTTRPTTTRRPFTGRCVDKNGGCGEWKRFCTQSSYASYMQTTCPLTCRVCTGGNSNVIVTTATSVECEDLESATTCRIGKILKYSCTEEGFMSRRCKKTCGCIDV